MSFEITVEREFCAGHALSIAGTREPVHGHNFHVTVCVAGETLDGDGLLCDFHTIDEHLGEIVAGFDNRNLNDVPPFADGLNPSAENVARYIGDRLADELADMAPAAVVAWVRVTEAAGCAATYRRGSR
ncbi:MAG: 6-pyruvoyl trahydropterin synthase family protein [Phycisphaerales bacterium]